MVLMIFAEYDMIFAELRHEASQREMHAARFAGLSFNFCKEISYEFSCKIKSGVSFKNLDLCFILDIQTKNPISIHTFVKGV